MKILIAGDFCPQNRVAELIEGERYHEVFGEVMPCIKQADLSIVNFEAPVVEHKSKGIDKCGPCLRGTSKSVDAIRYAGFNVATLANNHFYDYGEVGVADTLQACRDKDIKIIGGGRNLQEASLTAYFDICSKKLAIINCCEHEFSIATESTGGANPLNPILQYYAIKEARQQADYVFVIVHGGHEHYQLPSPRMKETYRFFVDAGADAVVNHHQHCYTGYEVYNGKPIFYGIGNFCFDRGAKATKTWQEGYMVMLDIFESSIKLELFPYVQARYEAGVKLVSDRTEFDSEIQKFNAIIADDNKLNALFFAFLKQKSRSRQLVFSPYSNRYLRALAYRGWLPSFLNNKKKLELINYIACESHRDITLPLLQRLIK